MVETSKPKSTQKPYKRKIQRKLRYIPPTNQNIRSMCFKCNKPSHITKYCRLNKILRNLEINEKILNQISKLWPKTFSNEEKALAKVELENNQMV